MSNEVVVAILFLSMLIAGVSIVFSLRAIWLTRDNKNVSRRWRK